MAQPADSTRDWPLDLIRSVVLDDLARQIYEAGCKWQRIRPNWETATRAIYRDMALDLLNKVTA